MFISLLGLRRRWTALLKTLQWVGHTVLGTSLTFSISSVGYLYVIPGIRNSPLFGGSESFASNFQRNEDFILCSLCAGWANNVQLETALCSSAIRRIFASDLNERWIRLMAKSSPYAEIHGSY